MNRTFQHEVKFARPRSVDLGFTGHNYKDVFPGFGDEIRGMRVLGAEDPAVTAPKPIPSVTTMEAVLFVSGLAVSVLGGTLVRSLHEGLGNVTIGIGGAALGTSIFANVNRRNGK